MALTTNQVNTMLGINGGNPIGAVTEDMRAGAVSVDTAPNTFTNYRNATRQLPGFDAETEMFRGTTTRQQILDQMRGRLEAHEDITESLDGLKAELGENSTRGGRSASRALNRNVDRLDRTLKRDAKRLYSVAERITTDTANAKATLAGEVATEQSRLATAYQNRLTQLNNQLSTADPAIREGLQEQISNLRTNFTQARDHLKSIGDTLSNRHSDTLTEVKSLVDEVAERTKISPTVTTAISTAEVNAERGASQLQQAAEVGMSTGQKVLGGALIAGGAGLAFSGINDENGPMNLKTGLGVAGIVGGIMTFMKRATPALAEAAGGLVTAAGRAHI